LALELARVLATAPRDAASWARPRIDLSPYEALGEIGRGGTGIVYRARAADGREVAVKVLRASGPDALARFERERRVIASLGESDGFVPLLDARSVPRGPCLVMP